MLRLLIFIIFCVSIQAAADETETIPATLTPGTLSLSFRKQDMCLALMTATGTAGQIYSAWLAEWPKTDCGSSSPTRSLVSSSLNGQTITYIQGSSSGNTSGSVSMSGQPEQWTCPSNQGYVLDNVAHTCTRTACVAPKYRNSSGLCVDPPSCQKGQVLTSGSWSDTNGDGQIAQTTCIGGCTGVYSGTGLVEYIGYGSQGVSGGIFIGKYTSNGEVCSGSTNPETATQNTTPEANCLKQGKSYGTVNGTTVCVDKGTPGSATITEKTPPKTTTSSTNNGATSTESTSTSTTVSGSTVSQTTTTTTTDPTTGQTSTTVQTKNQGFGEFCEENPNSNVCADESTTNGGLDCTTQPVSDGDAIQAAILFQAWKARCNTEREATDYLYAQKGTQILNGEQDTVVSPLHSSQKETKSLSSWTGLFDDSDLISGSGTCPSPKEVTILGSTYSFSFDAFCQLASMVGVFLLLGASIASIRMILGGL